MPKLVYQDLEGNERSVDLGTEAVTIGRSLECQVQTNDALVSRRHARVVWDGGAYWVEDLGSANGVYQGKDRVQRIALRPGDEFRCGSLVLRMVPDVSPRPARALSEPPSMPTPLAPPPSTGSIAALPPLGPAAFAPAATPLSSPDALAERQRAIAVEAAVLSAETKLAAAEKRASVAEARQTALEQRAFQAEEQLRLATARVAALEAATRETEALRARVGSLQAELQRNLDQLSDTGARSQLMQAGQECDRLRARIAELEAAAQSAVPLESDAALLKRRVEQLTAELRRLRGGQAPGVGSEAGRIADLEAKLQTAERERDEAKRLCDALRTGATGGVAGAAGGAAHATQAAIDAAVAAEGDKYRRVIEQLNAEIRRLRQGLGSAGPVFSSPTDVTQVQVRLAEMTVRAEQAERELAVLRLAAGSGAGRGGKLGELASALDDALADMRGSLRAARDEVGVLGVEAPGDSVHVLRESIDAAQEQLQSARERLRELKQLS